MKRQRHRQLRKQKIETFGVTYGTEFGSQSLLTMSELAGEPISGIPSALVFGFRGMSRYSTGPLSSARDEDQKLIPAIGQRMLPAPGARQAGRSDEHADMDTGLWGTACRHLAAR